MILNTSCILYAVKLDDKSPRNKLKHNIAALDVLQAISDKYSKNSASGALQQFKNASSDMGENPFRQKRKV